MLATLLAIQFGFTAVVLMAVLLYGLAAATGRFFRLPPPPPIS